MAEIHLLIFSLLTLTLTLTPRPTLSLYIHPPHNDPNFDPNIALSGDAENVNGSIQLTRPILSSSGLLVNTKPFNFLKTTSFSTDFSFSISPHSGLALLLFPTHFPRKMPQDLLNSSFAIEFDTSMEDVVSVRVSNVSSSLNLNSGVKVKLHAWVDYEASSKRVEVRLSEMGNARPYDPSIAFPIDLLKMWKGEEVLVGISSSSGNSQQTTSVFSWKFRVRVVPHWMHSQPLDPMQYSDKGSEKRQEHKKSSCPLRIVNGLMLGMACGALVAFIMLFLWTITVYRHNVIPSEYLKHPVGFGYEKVSVVVENSSENVKN